VFLLGLLIALSLAGHLLLQATGPALERLLGGDPRALPAAATDALPAYLAHLHETVRMYPRALLALVSAALGTWGLFGWAVNVNEFSLNAFYRNRLVRCYLGASIPNPPPTSTCRTTWCWRTWWRCSASMARGRCIR
jgi:hypothetical protein